VMRVMMAAWCGRGLEAAEEGRGGGGIGILMRWAVGWCASLQRFGAAGGI
jgi:hypothetical protein